MTNNQNSYRFTFAVHVFPMKNLSKFYSVLNVIDIWMVDMNYPTVMVKLKFFYILRLYHGASAKISHGISLDYLWHIAVW